MATLLLLDSIDTNWVVPILLLLSLCLSACLKLGQSSSHGASLLGPKIERLKLPLAVVFSQIVALILADHSQYSSNRLAHHLAVDKINTVCIPKLIVASVGIAIYKLSVMSKLHPPSKSSKGLI